MMVLPPLLAILQLFDLEMQQVKSGDIFWINQEGQDQEKTDPGILGLATGAEKHT